MWFTTRLALGLVWLCLPGPIRADDQPSHQDRLDQALWWLPADTQTIIVARGPFDLEDQAAEADIIELGLEKTIQQICSRTYGIISGQTYKKLLGGRKVLLALEGSRKFRSPGGLGLMPFEGANILIFQEDLDHSLAAELKGSATETKEIAGHQVLVFTQMMENDLWTTFVSQPRSDILVFATNRGYLKSVLERMANRKKTRALPVDLPEWEYVDPKARVWAIRHYDHADARNDPSSPLAGRKLAANTPDDQAVGLVCILNEDRARVEYLSTNRGAVAMTHKAWDHPQNGLTPDIRRLDPNAVEITVRLKEPPKGRGEAGMFLFILLAELGHGIYL